MAGQTLNRLADALNRFADTIESEGQDSGARRGRHEGDQSNFGTPEAASNAVQSTWNTGVRLKRTIDNLLRAAPLAVLVFIGLSLIANFLQFAPLSQAILVIPVVLLAMAFYAQPTAISAAFIWSETKELAERVADAAGYLLVIGLGMFFIPLHAIPELIVPFGVVLSAIGLFKLADNDSGLPGVLWLGAVAMVVAFFVADYNDGKPEPTTHAPTATTQQESTGGHVVATTSSSSVSHTATSSQATSAGSSNTYNASSSLEPSVQESPGPPANVGVALAEDPWVAQPGETVEYRVKLINHGQGEATRIEVTEELPQGLSFEDGSRRQTKVVENLASGDDKVVVFLVTVSGDTPRGHYRSVVTVLRVDAVNTRSTESMRSLTVRP